MSEDEDVCWECRVGDLERGAVGGGVPSRFVPGLEMVQSPVMAKLQRVAM